tara:strand:+ start:76 stop:390 length:315 start_codon:yes stop_codon:yes gene_type:complete
LYLINFDYVPDGFRLIDDKIPFDPKKYLQREKLIKIYSLKDSGYSEEKIKELSFDFATNSVFRILSDECSEIFLDITRKLEKFLTSIQRIELEIASEILKSAVD